MSQRRHRTVVLPIATCCLALAAVCAVPARAAAPVQTPQALKEQLPMIGIDQHLGALLPLDATFRDEQGASVRLGQFFGGKKPVLLMLAYFECPGLCNAALNGLLRGMHGLAFSAGQEFDVVVISFDPREGAHLAATKKRRYVEQYDRPGAEQSWHFLTGDAEAIRLVTEAVGFRYRWDERTAQFAHASGMFVATPEGRLARYFYGVEYSPRDMRLALVEAADGRIGSPVDQVLLLCYHYDPLTGRYGVVIHRVLQGAGVLTLALLGGCIAFSLRRERRRARRSYQAKTEGATSGISATSAAAAHANPLGEEA
ncbi:MAG: SCO family protein [Pirellulales bacterium]|nr:SCO family protein [Pirellulales bacterium]